METKVDLSGDMSVPDGGPKSKSPAFDFGNLSSKIPSITEALQITRKNIRPWSEFLNTNNYKTVASVQRLSGRFIRNLAYFQSNYICIFLVFMVYCLITSPLILIVLAGSFYLCYRIRKANTNFTLFGRQLNTNQQCIALNIACVPVLYIVGVGQAMFWTIGASCFVVSLHAVFYNIEAIVTEDTEGFLSEVV
ncbi:RABAC1 family protein [Megaselia abdita]